MIRMGHLRRQVHHDIDVLHQLTQGMRIQDVALDKAHALRFVVPVKKDSVVAATQVVVQDNF